MGIFGKALGALRKKKKEEVDPDWMDPSTTPSSVSPEEEPAAHDETCTVLDVSSPQEQNRWILPEVFKSVDLVADPGLYIQRIESDAGEKKIRESKQKKLIALNRNILPERIRVVSVVGKSMWWYEDTESWKESTLFKPSLPLLHVLAAKLLEVQSQTEGNGRIVYPIRLKSMQEEGDDHILLVAGNADVIVSSVYRSQDLNPMIISNVLSLLDQRITDAGHEKAPEESPWFISDQVNSDMVPSGEETRRIDLNENLVERAIANFPESKYFVPTSIRKEVLKTKALPVLLKWGAVAIVGIVGIVVVDHKIEVWRAQTQASQNSVEQVNRKEALIFHSMNERKTVDTYISHPPDLSLLYRHLYLDSLVLRSRAIQISVRGGDVSWRLSGVPFLRTDVVNSKNFLESSLRRDGGKKLVLMEPNASMSHVLVGEGQLEIRPVSEMEGSNAR